MSESLIRQNSVLVTLKNEQKHITSFWCKVAPNTDLVKFRKRKIGKNSTSVKYAVKREKTSTTHGQIKPVLFLKTY